MKIYLCKQGERAEFTEAENELEALQNIVGGYIEVIPLTSDLVLICNEEGKLKGLKPNRWITGDVIHGDFFICGTSGDEFCDVPSKYNSVLRGIYEDPQFTKAGEPDEM